jgi:hypothetical protein
MQTTALREFAQTGEFANRAEQKTFVENNVANLG